MRVFTDERCMRHVVPYGMPERPERLPRILDACRARGWEVVEPGEHDGGEEAIAAVHDSGYIGRFERAVERGDGLICSSDNPLSAGTWAAARGAVDAALAAADWVVTAPGRTAFAAVRPPGHHAEFDLAMGFCYFNNVAVAAEHLLRYHGVERAAIFDFDVHHGNGTQHLFEERGDVFYASVHQYPFYPGTGAAGETGRGAGAGATLNLPLPAGSGDEEYGSAVEGTVIPALRGFAPQVLLISAGFDAWAGDPLGGMRVSAAEFARWAGLLGELAAEVCEGRMLSLLEGGYALDNLGELVATYLGAG